METRTIDSLTLSHASTMFPAMPAAEYATLVASVRERGVMQPIAINASNEVIDGRHRLNAARDAGMFQVPVVIVDGDAVDAAVAANMERRTMTPSQRAALAVFYMQSTGRAPSREAARRFHVSHTIVAACAKLVQHGHADALPRIIAGELSVWKALREFGIVATPVAAPVAVVADDAPVAEPVAPVTTIALVAAPRGLREDVAAVIEAYIAGTDVGVACREARVDVAALDALATYLYNAADIIGSRG
jgi:hypothetical protein